MKTSENFPYFDQACNWMRDTWGILKSEKLKDICILGSHDAGMYVLNGHTIGSNASNTLTQSVSIGGQLNLGCRYFDIRPVIGDGIYCTGHYGYVEFLNGYQGGNGQSIDSIINDINNFTATHNELIILNLSHDLNTMNSHGTAAYRRFTIEEWDLLFSKLSTIKYLYKSDSNKDLSDIASHTLESLSGNNPCVIIVVEKAEIMTESYIKEIRNKGFFLSDGLFDKFSETNDLSKMIKDQLDKMRKYASDNYFLLSWTLTQSVSQATVTTNAIREMADSANASLRENLLHEVMISNKYPNIVYVDNIINTNPVNVVVELNEMRHNNYKPQLRKDVELVVSEPHPQGGQKHRSSGNFSTKRFGGNSQIIIRAYYNYGQAQQKEAPEIIFDINEDKTGKDGVFASGIKSGHICRNTSDRNLYIANPRNASANFTVEVSLAI